MGTPRWIRTFSRLNVFALISDQFNYLTNLATNRPEWVIRALVILAAPVTFTLSLVLHVEIQTVGDLVGALGLLSGTFIAAFALVFSIRMNMATKPTKMLERKTARLVDESALTLLAAGLLAGVDAIWLASVSASIPAGNYVVSEFATAVTLGLSSLVVLYFLLSIRRLHKLYTDTFVPFWKVKAAVEGPTPGRENPSIREQAAEIDARRNS